MNIRLIAGIYGGRVLDGSGTNRTHPMSERIRNAIFNSIGSDISGAEVLDAFAGSGAIGLEAISRGAATAVLVDKDRIAQRILEKNIATLKAGAQVTLIRANVASWAKTTDSTFDVIFADPPFHDPQLPTIEALFNLLKPGGLMVLSYPTKGEVPFAADVSVVDEREYGNAALVYYRKQQR